MLSAALQIGLPGTQEMVIVLLVLFFFLVPVGLAGLFVVYLLRRRSGKDERIEELERKVEQLREERATADVDSSQEG